MAVLHLKEFKARSFPWILPWWWQWALVGSAGGLPKNTLLPSLRQLRASVSVLAFREARGEV